MMTPLQRRAVWDVGLTTFAGLAVAAASPWMGIRAMGFFGFLGFLPFGELFLWRPGFQAQRDERDLAVERGAQFAGVAAMAYLFMMGLVAMTFTSQGRDTIPVWWLTVLIWSSFAVLYWVRAIVTLWLLRKDESDAPSP